MERIHPSVSAEKKEVEERAVEGEGGGGRGRWRRGRWRRGGVSELVSLRLLRVIFEVLHDVTQNPPVPDDAGGREGEDKVKDN